MELYHTLLLIRHLVHNKLQRTIYHSVFSIYMKNLSKQNKGVGKVLYSTAYRLL